VFYFRLRVPENRVLGRILGPKRDEMIGGRITLCNEERHNCTLPQVKGDDSGREYRTNGETRNAYRSLVGKPVGNRPLERQRRSWVLLLRWILERLDGVV
jgi:hypothetical protein